MKTYKNFHINVPFISINGKTANIGDKFIFVMNEKVYRGKLTGLSCRNVKGGLPEVSYVSPMWKVETNRGDEDVLFLNYSPTMLSPYIEYLNEKKEIAIYENANDYYNDKRAVIGLKYRNVNFRVSLFHLECSQYVIGELNCLIGYGYSVENGEIKVHQVYLHDFDIDYYPEFDTYWAKNMQFIELGAKNVEIVNDCNLFAEKKDCKELFGTMTEKVSISKQITITISENDDVKSVAEKILKEFSKK